MPKHAKTKAISHCAEESKHRTCRMKAILPFFMCDAMLARYLAWPCVRLSVRLSQVGVLSKRVNKGSRKRRHTTDKGP